MSMTNGGQRPAVTGKFTAAPAPPGERKARLMMRRGLAARGARRPRVTGRNGVAVRNSISKMKENAYE